MQNSLSTDINEWIAFTSSDEAEIHDYGQREPIVEFKRKSGSLSM